ncbi:hypothetical protein [Paractinoplanes ferrugineus]|uniref:hypothetical protein n=1 Tax=Paractinoplanes ferrugineus TaxID=113564 RepID=UPI001940DF4D|nr:hypothetical protein [Actinoplanes ferrugineus]
MAAVIVVAALLQGGCTSGAVPVAAVPASAVPSGPADNGVDSLEPAAIFGRARAALTEAKAFRLNGFVTGGGKVTGVDLEARGSDVRGTLTRNKAKVDVLVVGGNAYIRPDQAFWRANLGDASHAAAVIELIKDRWARVSSTDKNFAELFTIADVNNLLDGSGGWIKQYVTKVGTRPAVMLSQVDSRHSTLWVATEGPPYPLRLQGPTEADGNLTFSDFGATFTDLQTPPASTVVDFAELRSRTTAA